MVSKYLFSIFILLLIHFCLFGSEIQNTDIVHKARKITAEDEAMFEVKLKNATTSFRFSKLPNELGYTWYDYACTHVMGRMMAKSNNAIHFVFMKRYPNAVANRYVTYDYWDHNFNLFYGNQSITENQPTGWGRVVNGANNEAIVSMHGGGLHLYKDFGQGHYSFTNVFTLTPGGVFPGMAITGDTVLFMGQTVNANWMSGDTVLFSTDYMNTWSGSNIWPPDDPAMTGYGVWEMWPTFNPMMPGEFSVVYAPDITASAPNGSIKMATTNNFGASWNLYEIHNDDYIFPDNSQLLIENFAQMNSMYGIDGTYHVVMGAIQGYVDIYTSTQIDMFPLMYWNTRDQQFVDLSNFNKSHPTDPAIQTILITNSPSNGLGGFNYPTLSEGPNGELVCIWQEWEEDANGMPVMAYPVGGDSLFCTDIWGAYSPDGGRTWSMPFFVAGTQGESDVFPNITKNFEFDAISDSIIIDLAFMWDTNVGVSLFGDSDVSECVWYYERVSIMPEFGNTPYIVNIAPDSAYTGQNITVSITGQNTLFVQDTLETDNVWFTSGYDSIRAINVNVLNSTTLTAEFEIPIDAPLGLWNVDVEQAYSSGVVTLPNGFIIYERVVDSLSLSVQNTTAFSGDTVIINIDVEIPLDSMYSSIELHLRGFQNDLEFLELVTNNTLIGNAGWTYQVNSTDSILSISAAGANDISGIGTLFKIKLHVPDTLLTGFIPIDIDSAIFNTGVTHVKTLSGGILILIPNPGDVDLNNIIQAYDASLILKHLVGLINLHGAQLKNANVSLDTTISAFDADLILQYVVNLIDSLPYDTLMNAEGEIYFNDVNCISGEIVEIPLYFENTNNIRGFEAEIKFDATQLEFDTIYWENLFNGSIKVSHQKNGIVKLAASGPIQNTTYTAGIILNFIVTPDYNGEDIQVVLSKLRTNEGEFKINSSIANLNILARIEREVELPNEFKLYSSYPNPFNPNCKIEFDIPQSSKVKLVVYNTQGKLISVLVDDNLKAGKHVAIFNGTGLASGLYLYKIQSENYQAVKKMLLLK